MALGAAMYAFSRLQVPEVLRAQLLYLPFMALVIFVFAQGHGALSARLRHPHLVLLGDASFALYMIHLPILNGAWRLYESLGRPLPLSAYAIVIAGICIGLSVVTHRLVERPIDRWLKARLNGASPLRRAVDAQRPGGS
jgi:peptidoglycan/LPS O-acetylase OafA/YrhL